LSLHIEKFQANHQSTKADVLLYFLALFLPPVPVFIKRGCTADFLINIGLSILGWIPGVIRKFKTGAQASPLLTLPQILGGLSLDLKIVVDPCELCKVDL
jgi:uncharacterized membrane protein YqaE (UPF0057 family)